MKVYDKYKLNDANKKKALTREIAVLKRVDHSNLVKLVEVIETSRQVNIVMEYIEGRSLQSYVKSINHVGRIPEDKCRLFLRQIASAIEYLHKN